MSLSKICLDSSIPIDDIRLSIPGYSMMRADHPTNTKRDRVCLYYKEHLPIIRRDDNLKECLVTEVTVENEQCFLTCLYRSPSQNREQFRAFCDSLDILMNNIYSLIPVISIITGYFNGKSSKWYSFDNSDNIGKNIDTITLNAGYSQIIDKPTHFTNNSSSYIDLIFTSNPSISRHHDIIYLHFISGVFGIVRMLTLVLLSVLYKTLIGNMYLTVKPLMKSYEFLVKL